MGFAVAELSSGRQSFSPDASYYDGPLPANPMRFIEVRLPWRLKLGARATTRPPPIGEMAAKRIDDSEAGTAIVWDVDPIAETITAYLSASPDAPVLYTRGQVIEAEPAVPGWVVDVDWIFS